MILTFRQYDIIMVDLPKKRGSKKQAGVRPAVIISNDVGNMYSPTLLIMPITSKIKSLHQPTHTRIKKDKWNGLSDDSMVLGEQTTTVDKTSVRKIGEIHDDGLKRQVLACFLNAAMYKDSNTTEVIKLKGGKICTA